MSPQGRWPGAGRGCKPALLPFALPSFYSPRAFLQWQQGQSFPTTTLPVTGGGGDSSQQPCDTPSPPAAARWVIHHPHTSTLGCRGRNMEQEATFILGTRDAGQGQGTWWSCPPSPQPRAPHSLTPFVSSVVLLPQGVGNHKLVPVPAWGQTFLHPCTHPLPPPAPAENSGKTWGHRTVCQGSPGAGALPTPHYSWGPPRTPLPVPTLPRWSSRDTLLRERCSTLPARSPMAVGAVGPRRSDGRSGAEMLLHSSDAGQPRYGPERVARFLLARWGGRAVAASGAPPDAESAPGDIFRRSVVGAAGTVQGEQLRCCSGDATGTVPGKLPPASGFLSWDGLGATPKAQAFGKVTNAREHPSVGAAAPG